MRTFVLVVLSIALFGVMTAGRSGPKLGSSAGGGQDKSPPVVCGFRNPAYAGLCEERTPDVKDRKPEAICRPILDCLNNPRCIKTYCGSTTIRQGWTLESAKRAE